ncbi:RNA-binding S4 domain-containing protein [Curtobacterium sp. MCLR17_007]|uniref:RNA-binding S4 domain-containing protein n=1 Tax=unclassified Curtobacterium TaxID=257496 RepID=UPI0006FCBD40|nr:MULTISPECIES: RNA-binding S4 domain-containing protein [unclassified Curtobacterium]KQS08248.1 RNA-binding protein S4 [Curtobacterium sp. Leaf183]WIB61517.1 RNA-binding S4 domain-containing protein [Curtobacterium sp. MCLR17_007]
MDKARVDAWIWAVRITKTRSAATTACKAGHVKVNGERAKPSQPVGPGDEVRVRQAGFDRIVVVKSLILKRVGATEAAKHLDDRTPARLPKEEAGFVPMRDRGAGRPSKRERRDLEKLRGY